VVPLARPALGAEPIPAPNFGVPVRWLAVGATQLHLYEGDVKPPEHHHLGITVDDLERAYRVAERRAPQSEEQMRGRLFVGERFEISP
jgi:hypothetical protein